MIGNRNHHQPNHQNWQFKIRAALDFRSPDYPITGDHPISLSVISVYQR